MSGSAVIARIERRRAAVRLRQAAAKRLAASLFVILGAGLAASHAQAVDRTGVLWNSIPLPCWIEDEKVIAVVNSTGKTLPAGTTLNVNAVPVPDGEHFIRSKTIARTPTGGIIRIGAVPSSSCTASVRLPRPVLQVQ